MRPCSSLALVVLLAAFMAPSCTTDGSKRKPDPTRPDTTLPTRPSSPAGEAAAVKPEWKGFEFVVTAGGDAPKVSKKTPGPKPKPVRVSPLGQKAADRLLKRVKSLKGEQWDKKAFALRPGSPPAPRKGQTLKTAFPPPAGGPGPGKVKVRALKILRFSPEGDVPLAPRLSVTFSQPMVPITAHDDTVAAGVPVKLTPKLDGKWRQPQSPLQVL